MSHGRVGRELQYHYDVLLHLLCEHQRRLQEKILFRPTGGDRGEWAGRKRPARRRAGKQPSVSAGTKREEEGKGGTES